MFASPPALAYLKRRASSVRNGASQSMQCRSITLAFLSRASVYWSEGGSSVLIYFLSPSSAFRVPRTGIATK